MAIIDLAMHRNPMDVDRIISSFDQALSSDLSNEQKVTFAHRKIEFLEDYGSDVARYLWLFQNAVRVFIKYNVM